MKRTAWLVILCLSLFSAVFVFASEERFIYVTNEGDNNLMIIDLNTEKLVKTIATGKTPHVLAFTENGKCYVNNRGSKDLTVIDANKLEIINTILLPATSIQLAVSPDGRTLAVAYKDALKISFVNTTTDEIIKTVSIGNEPKDAFKGTMMRHSYWSSDGRYLYATDDVNNTVVKLDSSTGEIKAKIVMPGSTHYIHSSPEGKLLYAVNEATKTGTSVTLIDGDNIIKDIIIPLEPGEKGLGHHGVFTKEGNYFFICNEGGRTVAIIDTAKQEVIKTLRVGMGAGHPVMTRDGKYIFVIHHKDNVVAVIDTEKQGVINIFPVGTGKKQAHGGYVMPNGKYFYMINTEDNVINKVAVEKMEVISRIPVGNSAMFFGIREGKEFPNTE